MHAKIVMVDLQSALIGIANLTCHGVERTSGAGVARSAVDRYRTHFPSIFALQAGSLPPLGEGPTMVEPTDRGPTTQQAAGRSDGQSNLRVSAVDAATSLCRSALRRLYRRRRAPIQRVQKPHIAIQVPRSTPGEMTA